MRRTKIIVTLGPATDAPGVLERFLEMDVDLFRCNYSHETAEHHGKRVVALRALSSKLNKEVGVIVDLQGPKIRIQEFNTEGVVLVDGDEFTIDTELNKNSGDRSHVGVGYKDLPKEVHAGDTLLIDDGRIILRVLEVTTHEVRCKVIVGGDLTSRKGINLLGGGLSSASLTEKDQQDMLHGIHIGADYFAVSFVKRASDVHGARKILEREKSSACIIAKIECAEALERSEEIIEAADAIMIARGDLGVEVGDASLPPIQKHLITLACDMDRPVITATQLMQSMIDHQTPFRSEVFDVANAVLDGTDALMLSSETSIGLFPDKVVQTMANICEEIEKQRTTMVSGHRLNQRFERVDEAIAMATMYTANHIGAKAIVALTESGSTCRWMSRISTGIPIFAFTQHVSTLRRIRLYRGVYPLYFGHTGIAPEEAYTLVVQELKKQKIVADGDLVLATMGDHVGHRGGTNQMKIIDVTTGTSSSPAGTDVPVKT